MDQLREIRAAHARKHREHQLHNTIIPALGLLITLDVVLRSAYRIQRVLRRKWFTTISPHSGMETFRSGGKIYHLMDEIAPLLVESDVYEIPGMLTELDVLRARKNISKAQDLKFEQSMAYDRSLCMDAPDTEPIYWGYLKRKAWIAYRVVSIEKPLKFVEFIVGILEELQEDFAPLQEIAEFFSKLAKNPDGNVDLLDFQLGMKLLKYEQLIKPHLVFLTFLEEYSQPSWLTLDIQKMKGETLQTLETEVRNMVALMKARDELQLEDSPMEMSLTELVECPGCCNEFGKIDLWPLSGSPDDDFRVCITCYKSMCEE